MSDDEILEQRRLARQDKSRRDAELMTLHRRAVESMRDVSGGREVRALALSQVDKWEKGALCHPRYIAAWRGILGLQPAVLREAMLRDDAEGIALRQNSPFGFLAGRPR
jgi:hypothetical protein